MQNKKLSTIILLICLAIAVSCDNKIRNNINDPLGRTYLGNIHINPSIHQLSEKVYNAVKAKGENFAVSSASIFFCLSMLLEGAEDDNLRELAKFLRSPIEPRARRQTMERLLDGLNEVIDGQSYDENYNRVRVDAFKSMVANSVWVDSKLQIKDSFKNILQKVYHAEAINSDFSNPMTVNHVNEWVNINTNGLIPKVLDSIDRDTVMILINTLYFKARWLNPFTKESTRPDIFNTIDGKTVQKNYMGQFRMRANLWKSQDSDYLLLPYQSGKHAMLIKFGNNALEHVAQSVINELGSSSSSTLINLIMPKFDYNTDVDLVPILRRYGVNSIFTPSRTGFKGITDRQELFVGGVLHKTKIITDELGTEAAAVTMVSVGTTSVQMDDPIEVRLDRPFSYYIVDTEKKMILFAGALVK